LLGENAERNYRLAETTAQFVRRQLGRLPVELPQVVRIGIEARVRLAQHLQEALLQNSEVVRGQVRSEEKPGVSKGRELPYLPRASERPIKGGGQRSKVRLDLLIGTAAPPFENLAIGRVIVAPRTGEHGCDEIGGDGRSGPSWPPRRARGEDAPQDREAPSAQGRETVRVEHRQAHRFQLAPDRMAPRSRQPDHIDRRSDVGAKGGVHMVSVIDQRRGDAWIAAVQDNDQLWAEADELARDIIGPATR